MTQPLPRMRHKVQKANGARYNSRISPKMKRHCIGTCPSLVGAELLYSISVVGVDLKKDHSLHENKN